MVSLSTDEIALKIQQLSQPLLTAAGVDLVELKVGRHKQDVLIQFIADKPKGGISMGECERLNRDIVRAIDENGFLGDNYALELSSPGLDRPLKTKKDFLRNMSAEVRVLTKEPVAGKREWVGRIIAAEDTHVVIGVEENADITVPLTILQKAVLVI